MELYGQMASKPATVDLPALWKQLGVIRSHAGVTFDNGAPLAAVHQASPNRGVNWAARLQIRAQGDDRWPLRRQKRR
jgi:hypothetical protein